MEKKFKLPKEFALKWVEALRSGEYTQGEGDLAIIDENEDGTVTLQNTSFCCLGVAGYLCGNNISKLASESYLDNSFKDVPTLLLGYSSDNSLVKVLSHLNDGTSSSDVLKGEFVFRREIKHPYDKLTFLEIADFIEDNVEFV